jgi:TonB family protein
MYHSVAFERPKTFSLVNMSQLAAQKVAQVPAQAQKKTAQPKQKTATTPVPKKHAAKQVAQKETVQKEDTDELSELLGAIPSTKVSDISPSGSFKYPWYIQNVVSKVEDKWKPPMGLTNKKDAAVVVTFAILSDGSLSGASVAQSSGVSTLDNLAMRAIQLAAPFGKLPIGFSENKIEITYTLYYVKQ